MKDKGWWWVVPVLLLAAWLGARSLDADAIWYDEFFAIYNAGGAHHGPLPPQEILRRLAEYNPWQGPGYPLMLAGWGALMGWSAFAGRAFSLLAGLLAIAWTYRLGRDMASPRVGLSAALTLAASAFFVDYLHELRAYTLYALFTAMTLAAYWRLMTRKPGPVTQGSLLLGMLGLLYTHYFAGLAAVGLGLYHLLFARKTRSWRRVTLLMGAAAVLFLPWLAVMLRAVDLATADAARQGRALDAGETFQAVLYAFSNGVIVLLVVVGAAAFARGRSAGLLWFLAGFVLALSLILNALVPVITHVRYLMALWPLLALLVGLGVERLSAHGVPPRLVMAVWIGAGLWNAFNLAFIDGLFRDVHHDFFRPHLPVHTMTRTIAANLQTEDGVAFDAPVNAWAWAGAFDYYMKPFPVHYTMLDWLTTSSQEGLFYGLAQEFLADRARVWLGVERDFPPDFTPRMNSAPGGSLSPPATEFSARSGLIPGGDKPRSAGSNHPPTEIIARLAEFERVLADEGFIRCGSYLDLSNLTLDLYSRGHDCCLPPANPTSIMSFGGNIQLTHFNAMQTDEQLQVLAAWQAAPDVPRNTYSVALHLEDEDGQLAAQADYGLPPDAYACRVARISLADLPDGDYTLMITVYNWATGGRLPAVRTATGEEGERLVVETFVIGD